MQCFLKPACLAVFITLLYSGTLTAQRVFVYDEETGEPIPDVAIFTRDHSVTALTDAFDAQLRRTQTTLGDTTRDLGNLERGFSGGLRKAFDGLVFDGRSLSDALATVGQAMSRTVYNNAMRPVTDHFGGLLAGGVNALVSSMMPFADGAPFSQGRVMPFAKGGVVSSPTNFPMRGGTGLMGEAGPEAIMPLSGKIPTALMGRMSCTTAGAWVGASAGASGGRAAAH